MANSELGRMTTRGLLLKTACLLGVSLIAMGVTCPEECTSDADCDDGVFCNGAETCVGGTCQDGTGPCAADETCDEENDQCVSAACQSNADCEDDQFCDTQTGECVTSENLYATTRVDADFEERVHFEPSGHTNCIVCHHAADAGAGVPDASGLSCRNCHPDDPNEANSFKEVAHDQDESGNGCRQCHAPEFSNDCTFCHPDAP